MYIAYYFCHISKDVGDMVRFGSYLITRSSFVTVLPLFIYLRCESKLCTSEICIHICIYLYVLHLYLLFFVFAVIFPMMKCWDLNLNWLLAVPLLSLLQLLNWLYSPPHLCVSIPPALQWWWYDESSLMNDDACDVIIIIRS